LRFEHALLQLSWVEICFPLPLVSEKLKVIILAIGNKGRIFYALPN